MLWSSRPPGGWVSAEHGSCKKQRCCVLSGYIVSNCRATPWTIATRLLCPRDSPGKNTGVSCHFLLRGLSLTQGPNPCLLYLLHWQMILYHCATWEAQNTNPSGPVSDLPASSILCEISDSPRGLRCPRAQASALPSLFS